MVAINCRLIAPFMRMSCVLFSFTGTLHTGKRREFRFFKRLALPKNSRAIASRLAKLL